MLKLAVAATLVLAAVPALACDGEEHKNTGTTASAATVGADAKDAVKKMTVDEVAARLDAVKQKKAALAVFDVNSKETRAEKGIVPTAVLLPSAEFDTAVLPKDKASAVLFYCSSEQCGASHKAAKRAVAAGYSDVNVMSAGISGWVAAGKPVEKTAEAVQKPMG